MAFKKEWFNDESFWEYYAPIMFDRKHWEEVPHVADAVTRLCRLKLYDAGKAAGEGPRILDLCCGFGRLTAEFARRGFCATGVDITESYLVTARDDAAYEKLEIDYIHKDVRVFKKPGFFDAAVNLYISFGYFANPKDDALMVRNTFESLKDGGTFIIETLGKEIAVRDFVEREWFEKAGLTVLTEYKALEYWSLLQNRWIIFKDEQMIERIFTQRLYSAVEIRRLLLDTGFKTVEIYGNWNEAPYDQNAEMLIAVAQK
jgi:SAM-dependent methyltransferase